MDPFETLGVTQDMSADEIKAVYRKKILQHHPDVSKDAANAHIRTAELNAAFGMLKGRKPTRKEQGPRASSEGAKTQAHSPFTYRNFDEAPNERSAQEAAEKSARAAQQAPAERVARAAREKAERESQQQAAKPQHHDTVRRNTDRVAEINVQQGLKAEMAQALDRRKQQEAHKRYVKTTGTYADPRKKLNTDRGDLPGFHAVEKMRFNGESIELDIGSDAKPGRNVIAMPKMTRTGPRTLRQEDGIHIFEVMADQNGKFDLPHAISNDIKVEMRFGKERERANNRSQARQA